MYKLILLHALKINVMHIACIDQMLHYSGVLHRTVHIIGIVWLSDDYVMVRLVPG
jgi:hypothetical protein